MMLPWTWRPLWPSLPAKAFRRVDCKTRDTRVRKGAAAEAFLECQSQQASERHWGQEAVETSCNGLTFAQVQEGLQTTHAACEAIQLHAERYSGNAKVAHKTASKWTYKRCVHPQKGVTNRASAEHFVHTFPPPGGPSSRVVRPGVRILLTLFRMVILRFSGRSNRS